MEATGKKITVTDLLSLAVVKTLMKHPYINASLTEDGKTIITHNYVNLAMAVGMDNGLNDHQLSTMLKRRPCLSWS